MRLGELLLSAGVVRVWEGEDREINGISSDSRTLKRGEVFVALQGLRYDGNRYIGEALQRGAALVLTESEGAGEHILTVKNAREALARLWDAWYGHPARGMSLIGITGTNGKTSTAWMLFHILRQMGYTCGLIGTVGCRLNDRELVARGEDPLANMTTPDPSALYRLLSEMKRGGARYVVMEVTSHALAFDKTAPLFFKRGVFTNLTPDHLDLHGDMETYFGEKKKLFAACEGAVISCATPYGTRLCDGLEIPLWRVDGETVRDVRERGTDGVDFTLSPDCDAAYGAKVPVPGRFSAENGALAAMTAMSLSLPPQGVLKALSAFSGVPGRMERIGGEAFGFSVFIDYAHTPDALEKLLRTAREMGGENTRVTVLFGCGGDRDKEKRAEMGRVASKIADFIILTSDNCRSERPEDIIRDILRGVDKEKPYKVIADRAEAIEFAVASARAGDILLLAGKGHEQYEIRGNERLPFSEREVVERSLKKRGESGGHAD